MKAGQNAQSGSFGKSRPRPNPYQHPHANKSDTDTPKESPRPRSGYDSFPEKPPGFVPGMARAKTMRVPKKQGFAPGTPGGDEPPARNSSSYFTRSQPQYPPPPPGPPPNTKKPDPLRPDTSKGDSQRSNPVRSAPPLHPHGSSPSNASQYADPSPASVYRMSTPYATPGGEKTHFSTAGFEQFTRFSSSHYERNGWPKGYTPKSGSPLSPPGPGRHRSASPKMRSPRSQGSSSSTSTCSSDDEGGRSEKIKNSGRRASADHRSTTQSPKDPHQRPAFPSVRVEDESEASSENLRPNYRPTWNYRPRSPAQPIPKTYSTSQPTSPKNSAGSDPESFFQHRARRDVDLPKSPLHQTSPWNNQTFEKPVEKSRSWHEKFGSKEEGNNQRQFARPSPGLSKEAPPMYDSSEYTSPTTPLPFEDFDPRSSQHELENNSTSWPNWAIPSSILLKRRHEWATTRPEGSATKPEDSFLFRMFDMSAETAKADTNSSASFHLPNDNAASSAPRKTQSSENINTNFSPSGWHGKFSGDAADYLGASRNGTIPRGRMSPPKGRSRPHTPLKERPKVAVPPENLPPNEGRPIPPPPPFPAEAPAKAKFSEDQWRQTFKEPTWAYPPPPPIHSPRVPNAKRTKPLRKMSAANKRPTISKPAFVSASGEDEGDASNEASSVPESDGSSGNAMDIDPALTPPTAAPPQTAPKPQDYTDPIARIIRSAVPPPQSGAKREADGEGSLNLSDLKQTAPFAPSNSGLRDLNELKTTLPFPSAASAIPLQPSAAQQLSLPHPPKAPAIPDKVTQSTWDLYLTYIRAYMAEWNMFNHKMLAHFTTRQTEVETKLGSEWLGSVGNEGYLRYMKGVEEDFRVREHWDVSWEKHRECMKGLGRMKERAVKAKCTVIA